MALLRLGILVGVYISLNLLLATILPPLPGPADWEILWTQIPDLIASGQLYHESRIPYVWSPVAAFLLIPIAFAGPYAYAFLHVAALAFLRDWRVVALALVSWAFWMDVSSGNVMTFVFVSGVLALRGNRLGALAYLGLLVLVPRPLMLPLAAWLIVGQPSLRRPFAVIVGVHAALVGLSGYSVAWIEAAVSQAIAPPFNLAPTFWIGSVWLVVALPLALLFLALRRFGLSGVIASPYLLEGYLLILLWELVPTERGWFSHGASMRPAVDDRDTGRVTPDWR